MGLVSTENFCLCSQLVQECSEIGSPSPRLHPLLRLSLLFLVKCDLCLTKAEGANLLATFLLLFSLKRLIAMFLAMKLNPTHILAINVTITVIGNVILVVFGEQVAKGVKWVLLRGG